uniref:Glycogenin 1 n=1 Tax=Oryctolagus cuniculus TaxID=9986 RepID=A0A5F9CQK0_RABIT
MTDQAFVTLTTNDAYAEGALVLGSSLTQHRTSQSLAVLTAPHVSDTMRKPLDIVSDEVTTVDILDSGDSAHLTLMKRPELGVALTKLHCWSLTQYSKCVFVGADTLVLANIDAVFERELSAAPDPGWPDRLNPGVFVYQPSVETYNQLLHVASERGMLHLCSNNLALPKAPLIPACGRCLRSRIILVSWGDPGHHTTMCVLRTERAVGTGPG